MYKYIVEISRPSTNDLFVWEICQLKILGEGNFHRYSLLDHTVPFLLECRAPFDSVVPNCVGYYSDTTITWDEIVARIDELRPDLRDWLKPMLNMNILDHHYFNTPPEDNPFSLSKKHTFEFNSLEDLKKTYQQVVDVVGADIKTSLVETKNTWIETFLDPDNNEIIDIVKQFQE